MSQDFNEFGIEEESNAYADSLMELRKQDRIESGEELPEEETGEKDEFYQAAEEAEEEGEEGAEDNADDDANLQVFTKNAGRFGITVDTAEFKDKKMSGEQYQAELEKRITEKHLSSLDPLAAAAIKAGVSPMEYYQRHSELAHEMNMPIDALGKQEAFERVWKQEYEAETLPATEKEAVEHVRKLTDAWIARLDEAKIAKLGTIRQERIKGAMDGLGGQLAQTQEQRIQQHQQAHKASFDAFYAHEAVKKYHETGGVMKYTSKAEQADFEKYSKEMLSLNPKTNATVIYEKLGNDTQFLLDVVRLKYMHDKGILKNISAKGLAKAWGELDDFAEPAAGGANGKKPKFVDTSKPH